MKNQQTDSFKVFGDPKVGAITILNDDQVLLFKGRDGSYQLPPTKGVIDDLSPRAYFTRTRDKKLKP